MELVQAEVERRKDNSALLVQQQKRLASAIEAAKEKLKQEALKQLDNRKFMVYFTKSRSPVIL